MTPPWAERVVEGWGRFPRVRSRTSRPETWRDVRTALRSLRGESALAYAQGRSYGDAALLRDGATLLTHRLDRMLAFDPETGWLRVEAGATLSDIIHTLLPRGFFPPVVPGTQHVSVGGALAADVHGKNHHVAGTFGSHVRRVEIMTASGDVVICDHEREPELFWATRGGMGLTGVVLSMEVQLKRVASPAIEMETIRVDSLEHFFEVSAESRDWPYTVGWIDGVARGRSLGRGIFTRGRHAPADARKGLKHSGGLGRFMDGRYFEWNWLLNRASIRLFNWAYYRKQLRRTRRAIANYAPFFFPLDAIPHWNLMYGKRGFLQYQFVVPPDPEHRAVREALDAVSRAGAASFLGVIKEFGDEVHGGLSFPSPGVTVALDFANTGERLLRLLERLDSIVSEAGGRVYLAKDARLSRDAFRRMYPEWERWKAVRDRWDPGGAFQSELGRRLGLVGD